MEYLTSDEHFDHENIIKYCNRPFSSVAEMNDRMVSEWNNIVMMNDTVYVIGDFALTSIERIYHFCKILNGRKILIKGNHDRHTIKKYKEAGFHNVAQQYRRTIQRPVWTADDELTEPSMITWKFNLNHRPPPPNQSKSTDENNDPHSWTLCGHVHEKWKIDRDRKVLNVGVDIWNYKPITFDQIINEILTNSP